MACRNTNRKGINALLLNIFSGAKLADTRSEGVRAMFTRMNAFILVLVSLLGLAWTSISTAETVKFRMVVAKGDYSLAVARDGSVWAWGDNGSGQVGAGQRVYPKKPVRLSLRSDVLMVAAGQEFSLAVCKDGTVWAWGDNSCGQLGDGTTINRYQPTEIHALRNIVSVAAGDHFALALTRDGEVWTWGRNNVGQLGHGTIGGEENTPRKVDGLRNIHQITAGKRSAYAIDAIGNLWEWGQNDYGQLGIQTHDDAIATPFRLSAVRHLRKISAANHVVALTDDGAVWVWGLNEYGQLGLGDERTQHEPVQLSTIKDVVDVAAGDSYTVFLKGNGRVYACGWNAHGQLDDDSRIDHRLPELCGRLQNISAITAGKSHGIALDDFGDVWAWGSNSSYEVDSSAEPNVTLAVQTLRIQDDSNPRGEEPAPTHRPGTNNEHPNLPVEPKPTPSQPPVAPKPPVSASGIVTPPAPVTPAWLREPLGSFIYYSAKAMKTSHIETKSGQEQVYGFRGSDIALSPNRRILAYRDNKDQLHVYYLDNGRDVMLSDPDQRRKYASPTFVGNNTIAYLSQDRNYRAVIYLTTIDRMDPQVWPGTMPERTTVDSSTLRWIPGTDISHPSFILGNVSNIVVLAPEGNTTIVSVSGGTSVRYPAISPDGRTIAYERDAAVDSIWTIDVDGRNMRQLTQSDGGWPTWSPDGRYIAFLTCAVAERGLLKRDIYNSSKTQYGAGFYLFGIGIMRRDGTPVKSVCGADGKPVMTHGDGILWQ
ncbi:MAG TPA: hypothetical protein VHV83_20480 [Armatimonadota bacterium]|nr:hypothetical protein [Armatimonadota bacterium]